MSLADDIREIDTVRCGSCRWWKTIDTESQQAVNEFLNAGGAASDLHKVCRKWGLDVSDRAFRDHLHAHHEAK